MEEQSISQSLRSAMEKNEQRRSDLAALEAMKKLERKNKRKLKPMRIDGRTLVYATPGLRSQWEEYKK